MIDELRYTGVALLLSLYELLLQAGNAYRHLGID